MYEEWKHVWRSYLPWLLLCFCFIVNGWIMWNYRENRKLTIISKYVSEEGTISVSKENTERLAEKFLNDSEEEKERQSGVFSVKQMLEGAVYMAEHLRAKDLAAAYVGANRLQDKAKEYAEYAFEQLESVMQQNRENKIADAFFVPCNRQFFELYSRGLLKACTVESIIAAVILMMRLVHEPFSTGTADVVYATKTGRCLQRKKRRAGIAVSFLFSFLNFGITFGAAAWLYPLGNLWNTNLGSMMLLDQWYPIITRFPMTVRDYLVIQAVIGMVAVVLFTYWANWLVLRMASSLKAIACMAFVCVLIETAVKLCPTHMMLYFYIQYQPVELAKRAGRWLLSGGNFFSPVGYEIIVFCVWGIAVGLLLRHQTKRFEKSDLLL